MLLLILLAYCFLPLSAIAPCPLPAEVSPSYFPPGWTRKGDFDLSNDGTYDYFECQGGTTMAQYEAGPTKTFTLAEKFRCDTTSKKWIIPDKGFEAPPIMTCGLAGPGAKGGYPGDIGFTDDVRVRITLFRGSEQICPSSKILMWYKGMPIEYMEVAEDKLSIKFGSCYFNNVYNDTVPAIVCVLPFCQIDHVSPYDGTIYKFDLIPGYEQYCDSGETLQFDNGTIVESIKCSAAGLEIKGDNGLVWPKTTCRPKLTCVSNSCPIKYRHPNGTVVTTIVKTRDELCPNTTEHYGRLPNGEPVINIICDGSDITVRTMNGQFEYNDSNPPTIECAPFCMVRMDGDERLISLGREQFCPPGEMVGLVEDGKALLEINCKSSGIVDIVKQDGSVIAYPQYEAPNVTCYPGICTQTCGSTTTTTTTTTTVATTTTIPAYCPPDGVWSEWTVTGVCASTCGANNVAARTRNCTDKCGKNCPCTGLAEDVGPCGIALCSFPATTCKAPYKKVFNYETSTFFCGEDAIEKVVCPLETTTTAKTTTVAPTTTTPMDLDPTAAQLWNVKFYYNDGRILHAFCADQACINVIQANGIGYDMGSTYQGLVGRAIREDAISAVRARCPTGSANLRNLGFTKVGSHYEHNLNGSGLKQGWVSITYGACGATKPIKKWKCHFSEDMMYHEDLSQNTYYKGLAQNNGIPVFYMYY